MSTEKIDLHYHQQLSALVDGELAPDQARFLLRRLQHDGELAACIDRWQLAGDVLRGNAYAPAPAGFSSRIAAAVAAEAAEAGAARAPRRGHAVRWGGGALAASVAAVALFLAVPRASDDADTLRPAPVAVQADRASSEAPAVGVTAADLGPAVAANAEVETLAPLPGRVAAPARGGASRARQAARSAAVASRTPRRAAADPPLPVIHSIATTPPASGNRNPFSDVRVDPPVPRPWPRAVLPQYTGGAFSARYPGEQGSRAFYPFDPKLPASPPLTPSVPASGDDD